jgi:poly(beta-D-mannuronate) lyase
MLSPTAWACGAWLTFASGAAIGCGAPPPAVIDIDANRYYMDSHNSVIDPALKARNEAATRPVDDFLKTVAGAASDFQAGGKPAAAECGLAWLDAWAGQQAMLGKMATNQSYYTRKWALAGLSLSYARLLPAASDARRQRINAWLGKIADLTLEHADANTGKKNNHYYWEGLAVAAAGAVTRNERQLAWGRKVFDSAMAQVEPDGSLPLEMARAKKALSYHQFSAAPLAMLASVLDTRSPKLDLLVNFTLAGVADPKRFKELSGFEQEPAGRIVAWLPVYERLVGRPASFAGQRLWTDRLGGDLSLANPLEHPLKLTPR